MTLPERAEHYSSIVRDIEAQIELLESILDVSKSNYTSMFLSYVETERNRLIQLIS